MTIVVMIENYFIQKNQKCNQTHPNTFSFLLLLDTMEKQLKKLLFEKEKKI